MILVILLNKESKTFTVDSDCYEALVNVYFERTKEFIKVTEGVEINPVPRLRSHRIAFTPVLLNWH